jgi:hypothetical protein
MGLWLDGKGIYILSAPTAGNVFFQSTKKNSVTESHIALLLLVRSAEVPIRIVAVVRFVLIDLYLGFPEPVLKW